MLEPLPPRPTATVAAEQAIRRAILDGSLAVGDRLPPERELAEQLGVSRLTLRAALATLSAAGLLAVKHGSGYHVRDYRASGGSDLLVGIVELAEPRGELPNVAADLLRVRRHLAGAVFDAIAERPPRAAERKAFRAAVDAFASAIDGGVEAIAIADLAVLRALIDATGSAVLAVCINPVAAVVMSSPPLRNALYAEPRGNLDGWRALADWIDRPTADAIPVLLGILGERDRLTLARLRRRSR